MGDTTKIEWAERTFNCWTGCHKVSLGCKNCYAESWANRWNNGGVWGAHGTRKVTSDAYWRKPFKWDRAAEAKGRMDRVFCASLADAFEDRPELVTPRGRLFELIEETPHLMWLLLTKRPENMLRLIPERWEGGWPENTCAMTSVENQEIADLRISILQQVPAPYRALSVEPLIGPVDLSERLSGIDWVIVGGESGPNARPMKPAWARKVRQDCLLHSDAAFFFKQWGAYNKDGQRVGKKKAGRALDGTVHNDHPFNLEIRQLASDMNSTSFL